MLEPGGDEHEGRLAVGERADHPRAAADLAVEPLDGDLRKKLYVSGTVPSSLGTNDASTISMNAIPLAPNSAAFENNRWAPPMIAEVAAIIRARRLLP